MLNSPTTWCILSSEDASSGIRRFFLTNVGPETLSIAGNDFRRIHAITQCLTSYDYLFLLFQQFPLSTHIDIFAKNYGGFSCRSRGQLVFCVRDCTRHPLPVSGERAARPAKPHGNSGIAGLPNTQPSTASGREIALPRFPGDKLDGKYPQLYQYIWTIWGFETVKKG